MASVSTITGSATEGSSSATVASLPRSTTAGNTGIVMANSSTSTVATMNSGTLITTRLTMLMTESLARPRRTPATTPSTSDSVTPTSIAGTAMSMLLRKATTRAGATGSPLTSEVPKSPRAVPSSQSPYRSHTLRSRPSDSRKVATASGVASWPRSCWATSPGSSWISRGTRTETRARS